MTITPEEKTRRLDAIVRALDWLEAHPEKHIAHKLAEDDDGCYTAPTGVYAVCFCALGRIVKEADIAPTGAGWLFDDFFTPLGINTATVHRINDQHVASFHKDKAIKALRQYMLEGQMV